MEGHDRLTHVNSTPQMGIRVRIDYPLENRTL